MSRGPRQELAAGRRLFVAIPVPEPVCDAVESIVDKVRAGGDPSLREVRWVRLDGLHLTLRFLGPTDERRVPAVVDAVDRVARDTEPFEIVIAGGGAFPTPARPRALWLGVTAGVDELAAAATRLDDALSDAGWPRDDRPYRPHLTLARSDGVRAGPAVARRLIDAATGLKEPFRAESVALFESVSGGGPARYVPLHEAHLG